MNTFFILHNESFVITIFLILVMKHFVNFVCVYARVILCTFFKKKTIINDDEKNILFYLYILVLERENRLYSEKLLEKIAHRTPTTKNSYPVSIKEKNVIYI